MGGLELQLLNRHLLTKIVFELNVLKLHCRSEMSLPPPCPGSLLEKDPVGGGGGWVCKPILVIDLGPLPTSGPIKGDSRTKFKTFFERKKNYDIKNLSNTPSIKQCNHLLFCIVYQSIFHLYKHFTY